MITRSASKKSTSAAGTHMAPNEYPYRVMGSWPVTPVIREFLLEPDSDQMRYQAGQYVLLGDPEQQLPPRSYSVANAPRADG